MPAFDSAIGDIPWYALPNTTSTLFGGSKSSMQEEGTLYRYAGPAINPGATNVDSVLATFTLPAGSFDAAPFPDLSSGVTVNNIPNRGVAITAIGSFGATANNKRIKILVGCTAAVVGQTVSGGTLVADTGTVATNANGWAISAEIYKYGAAGSNTQVAIHQQAQMAAVVGSLLAPQTLTLAENAPIIIAVVGNATTAATDIGLFIAVITGFN